jgi:hypothetical protein
MATHNSVQTIKKSELRRSAKYTDPDFFAQGHTFMRTNKISPTERHDFRRANKRHTAGRPQD